MRDPMVKLQYFGFQFGQNYDLVLMLIDCMNDLLVLPCVVSKISIPEMMIEFHFANSSLFHTIKRESTLVFIFLNGTTPKPVLK